MLGARVVIELLTCVEELTQHAALFDNFIINQDLLVRENWTDKCPGIGPLISIIRCSNGDIASIKWLLECLMNWGLILGQLGQAELIWFTTSREYGKFWVLTKWYILVIPKWHRTTCIWNHILSLLAPHILVNVFATSLSVPGRWMLS